jgi:hypothetical protein
VGEARVGETRAVKRLMAAATTATEAAAIGDEKIGLAPA